MKPWAVAVALALLALRPAAGDGGSSANAQTAAEQRLRAQRDELDRVRRERDELLRKQQEVQGRVHDLSEEVTSMQRQAAATAHLVQSLDAQLRTLSREVDSASMRVAAAEREVNARKGALHRRLIDIYKRGPLFTTEALLSAQSFGELLARYKYLHELTLRDRALVHRVEDLHAQIDKQRQWLVRLQDEYARSREEKANEEQRLRSTVGQRQASLLQAKESAKDIVERLGRMARDEQRLASLISTAEDTRRRNEARPNAPAPTLSSLKTADFGKLDWPVDGEITYRFGRAINPNNTAIRWNGVGIQAPAGTPVRAVASGEVMVADAIGTYGLTVIVQHGGGDYSVYGSLGRADVKKGDKIAKGQALGTIGSADPDQPPHLHFEIRPKGRATDPLAWLQARAGLK